ncbi:MAG: DNA methyltransferase [Rhodobacteraceae bacterium]|nr:DNA methyltransferase [Paracoccaceae bacterium]
MSRKNAGTISTRTATIFSGGRDVDVPPLVLPENIEPNTKLKMDGLAFLEALPDAAIPVAFFDPQYRGVLDRLSYGNERTGRCRRRSALQQMPEDIIGRFIRDIDRVLIPSGHLFLWVDKFHLCQGVHVWLADTVLDIVDLVTWDKDTFGMGYRTRRRAEYCIVLQKKPRKAKGVWKVHTITDVVRERVSRKDHLHAKPVGLQGELIAAASNEGDYVIDPAAGSFSVMHAAQSRNRNFIGCDVNG